MHPRDDSGKCRRKAIRAFTRLLEEMKGQPLRRLLADTGQPGELGHQLVYDAHRPQSAASGLGESLRISA